MSFFATIVGKAKEYGAVVVGTVSTAVATVGATITGTNVALEPADISAVGSSISGLGTSILNFITDIGPVVVPLVAALWIGSKLMGAFRGRM